MYEQLLDKRRISDWTSSKPGALPLALSCNWTTVHPSQLVGLGSGPGSVGADHLCQPVQAAVLPCPRGPESQLHRQISLSGCKNNRVTFKHTSSLFLWWIVLLTNGWKLLVGSKAQLSFRDNEKKGEIQSLSVSTAVAWVAFGPVDLFLLCWAFVPLHYVMGTSLRLGSCISGLAVKFWNWPWWWERRGLLTSTFSTKLMSKLAQAQCLKVKPSKMGKVLRNALE